MIPARTLQLIRRCFPCLLQREEGASAVEFALLAPVLVFACLTTVDLGLALYDRMTLDHVLRAGAQSAMGDIGAEEVAVVLEATATNNFAIAGETNAAGNGLGSGPLTIDVDRYCSCPDDRSASVSCTAPCPGTTPPFVFYKMSASTSYDGMIIPSLSFRQTVEVQVR